MQDSPAGKPTIRVHHPVATAAKVQHALAQRLPSLDGKVIGLLDNTKDLVVDLLGEAKAILSRQFPTAQFRYFRKPSVSGATPELIESLAACDAVVTGVGD